MLRVGGLIACQTCNLPVPLNKLLGLKGPTGGEGRTDQCSCEKPALPGKKVA